MGETTSPDTRVRILRAALDLFARYGYQRTPVRRIAERLGLTKTAVLYHFPAKADILAALAEPLVRDLEAAVAAAVGPDPRETRRKVVEGVLEAYLTHRRVLRPIFHDLASLTGDSVSHRFVRVSGEVRRLVAGPDPDLAERVRAAQIVAMLGDPVVLLAGTPTESLRREVLAGVRGLFGEVTREHGAAAPDLGVPPGPRRRTGGRPGAMSPEMIGTARRMHADGSRTVAEIAAALGVSRATVYRHLPLNDPHR